MTIDVKIFYSKMENLGEIIRKLRKEKKTPLRKVAAYLDIDQAILSKIERGQRKPTRENVVKIADYFKVNPDNLLISWLSDKLVYEVADEKFALKALRLAEEKIVYQVPEKIDRKDVLRKIKKYLEEDGRVSKAWLFGSFAREEDDFTSDIDVMIEVPQNLPFSLFDIADIQFYLEKLITQKVDLVMSKGVSSSVMKRIKPDLKVVYER